MTLRLRIYFSPTGADFRLTPDLVLEVADEATAREAGSILGHDPRFQVGIECARVLGFAEVLDQAAALREGF